MKRSLLFSVISLVLLAERGAAQPPSSAEVGPDAYVADFDSLWRHVDEHYAYLDSSRTDWDRVRVLYRGQAAEIRTHRDFVTLLETVLRELYDLHAHLATNTAQSLRLFPSGAEVWAEWRANRAIVTAVRDGSEAERSGLRPGMEIVTVNGDQVRAASAARMPKALRTDADADAAANWALRSILAGRRDESVRVSAREGSTVRMFEFRPLEAQPQVTPLIAKRLPGNIGYIRINNSLGERSLAASWDSALATLRTTRALVLDLRDTPSGGNTTIARAIMSRLIREERPYQRHELPMEDRQYGVKRIWVEYVLPRGGFAYTAPMAVLVGRWTGSMGEGIAIGFDGMKRATVVGSPMAGLLGAVYDFKLPNTGFTVRIPAERLYHIDGTPREKFVPRVVVESREPARDIVLAAALKLFDRAKP